MSIEPYLFFHLFLVDAGLLIESQRYVQDTIKYANRRYTYVNIMLSVVALARNMLYYH